MGIPLSKIATKTDEDAGAVVVLDAIEKAHLEQEIQKNAPRVMKHMNDDHEESLVAYVLAFATGVEGHIENNQNSHKEAAVLQQVLDGKRSIRSAQLTNVDRLGYLLEISTIEMGDTDVDSSSLCKVSNVRVPYDRPIHKAKELHHIAVRMHRAAYDKLGIWYKTKNGYYVQVVKIVAGVSYKSMKKNKKTTTAVVVVGAAAAAYLLVGGSHETKEIGNNKSSGNTNLLSRSVTTAEMLKSRMTYWMGRE